MNGLSKYYIKKIINSFSAEMTATETSRKLKINRNTVNKYYRIIRGAVTHYQQVQSDIQTFNNTTQLYYFSWHKNKGLIHTMEEGFPAFSLKAHNDKIFIDAIDSSDILDNNINGNSKNNEMVVETKEIMASKPLYETTPLHLRPKRKLDTASRFFIYAKKKLTKFYGVKEEYTYLYLKELEFRFNNQDKDLSKLVWKILPHHSAEWLKTSRHRR